MPIGRNRCSKAKQECFFLFGNGFFVHGARKDQARKMVVFN